MKRKKIFIGASLLGISILGISTVATIKENNLFVFANNSYTCALPEGYVEIEKAVETALINGSTPTENSLKFRGTVTAIVDDCAYLQRKNQTNIWTDGIKIKGVSTYAQSLAEGNVIDILGGNLYIDHGQPVLELTNSADFDIPFASNPFGYGPINYATYHDYLSMGFRDPNQKEFDCAVSIKANSLKVTFYAENFSHSSLLGGKAVDYFEAYSLENPSESYSFYIDSGDSDIDSNLLSVVVSAYNNSKYINLTGYTVIYDSLQLFHIAREGDIELGEGAFDPLVFDSCATFTTYKSLAEGNSLTSTLYYPKNSDIPYISFLDYYNEVFLRLMGLRNYDHVLIKSNCDSSISRYYSYNAQGYVNFNFDDDVITFYGEDVSMIDTLHRMSTGNAYLVTGLDKYCSFNEETSRTLVEFSKTQTFDLGEYNISLIGDSYYNAYIPLSIANDILLVSNGFDFAFNGRDCFYTGNFGESYAEGTMEYAFYATSPFFNAETMGSIEYCEFAYNELCFTFDHSYGLLEERGVSHISDVFVEMGIDDDLKSTDPAIYEQAMSKFVGSWVYDGHARYSYRSPKTFNTSISKPYEEYLNENARYTQLMGTRSILSQARTNAGKEVGLRIYGEMAVISFDSFMKYTSSVDEVNVDNYTYAQLQDMGTDLLFYKAFAEISANPSIKYVVLDISINGGGMVDAIPTLEAYMTLDPSMTNRNRLTGEVFDVHYEVDLNRDGDITSDDTFANDYDFFLLTSNFSFSCANMFPTIIKDKGLATIIGETSGGGECIVGMLSTAHGCILRNSSNRQGGHWDSSESKFIGNDNGITPDYSLERSKFYDDSELYNFITSII